jgi:hypothetical protein
MHTKAVKEARRLSAGERENEKTPHFSARCDSGCNGYDRGMHIIVKPEFKPEPECYDNGL